MKNLGLFIDLSKSMYYNRLIGRIKFLNEFSIKNDYLSKYLRKKLVVWTKI